MKAKKMKTKKQICDEYQYLLRSNPAIEDMYLELAKIIEDSLSCEGCRYKPEKGENYRYECEECSRWYTDGYSPKEE